MGSFQSGFQMGGDIANQAIRNAMAERELAMKEAAEGRAATEFQNRQADRAREDEAFSNYSNLSGGINRGTQDQLRQTYGMNPQQIAAGLQGGGAAGLQAKLASYDAPDSYDLQSVPAAGVQPRFDASQLKAVDPSRLDRERGLEQLSVARRDIAGIRESQKAQRGIQIDDITAGVMKRPISEIEKLAPDINMSGYPLLYTGKTKNGYSFLKTEADGKTPIPGTQFNLNESQLRQMALAHELGAGGFGTEAMTALQGAHKDIGEHVGRWNDAQAKIATSNTQAATGEETARHNRATEANQADHNALLRDHYGAMKKIYDRPQPGNIREFTNDKNEPVMVDLGGLPRNSDGTISMPTGLKPKNSKMVDPTAYWGAMEKAMNVYGDSAKARMAVDSYFGLTAPTNDVAAQLKALNEAKSGKGGGLNVPGAPAPAAPAAQPAPRRGFEQMHSDASGELQTLNTQLPQLEAQASAAARSGNTESIIYYGNQLNAARARQLELTQALELYTR
jgi:hypothetical protein